MSGYTRRLALRLYQRATGRHVLDALDDLNRTQWLGEAALDALQRRRLHSMLRHAADHVPYYQEVFRKRDFDPDQVLVTLSGFIRLPLLTRDDVSQRAADLIARGGNSQMGLSEERTGGSTGSPMKFKVDSNFRDYLMADVHRHFGWMAWSLGDATCFIRGARRDLGQKPGVKARWRNWAFNQFETNACALLDGDVDGFVEQYRRHRPRILHGYASATYRLAQHVRDHKIDDVRFDAIFTAGEVLFPSQREFMESVLGGRVLSRYSTRELGGIACECPAGAGSHVSMENNLVEILVDGRPAEQGETGDIVVTNLTNRGMPLVRYRVGDKGRWTGGRCGCGRSLRTMEVTEGRGAAEFVSTRGMAVMASDVVDSLFRIRGVNQFQVVQESPALVVIRLVANGEIDREALEASGSEIQSQLPDTELRFEYPDVIPALDSGKYLHAMSKVAAHRGGTSAAAAAFNPRC